MSVYPTWKKKHHFKSFPALHDLPQDHQNCCAGLPDVGRHRDPTNKHNCYCGVIWAPVRGVASSSTLHNCNGSQLDALLRDAGVVTGLHYLRDVLVRLRGLFHNQLRWRNTYRNPLVLEAPQNLEARVRGYRACAEYAIDMISTKYPKIC